MSNRITIKPFTTADCRKYEVKNLDPNFDAAAADKYDKLEYVYHILRTMEKETYRDRAKANDLDEAAYLNERLARIVNGIQCISDLGK